MKLPGQNVLILGAICISILGSIGAYKIALHQKQLVAQQKKGIVASASESSQINTKKSDYDSILEQVELAKINTAASSTNPFAPIPSDTMTDTLSKNIFTSYVQYQNNDQLDANGQAEIADKVVGNIDASSLPSLKYSLNNVSMYYPKNTEEARAYGNTFAQIRAKSFNKIAGNPNFYNKNLSALGTVFAQLGEELMTMKVPAEVANAHLEIANRYIRSGQSFKIIADQSKDPLKSLLGLKVFKEDSEKQTEMYTEIGNYFKRNGILFDNTEAGVLWNELK